MTGRVQKVSLFKNIVVPSIIKKKMDCFSENEGRNNITHLITPHNNNDEIDNNNNNNRNRQ